MHRMSAALHHFKNKFPDLKYMTVCEWRKVIIVTAQKDHKGITELQEKKGRPVMLPENLISFIMKYIRDICNAGGIINTAIVIAAALGIMKKVNSVLLECNEGHIILKKVRLSIS